MHNQEQLLDLLRLCPLGMGFSDQDNKLQETQSANKKPNKRKKKGKLKLGLIKG